MRIESATQGDTATLAAIARGTVRAGLSSDDLYSPFTQEKVRGMVVSLLSSAAGNVLNVFGQSVLGWNPLVSTAVFMQVFSSLLVYVLDILFAKATFHGAPVPYGDFIQRAQWLWTSFTRPPFMKFIVTALIDLVIGIELLRAALSYLDDAKIEFRFRNELVAAAISIVVFVLWTNAVRFNWAYLDDDNPVMNIVMVAWMALALMVFSATRNVEMRVKAQQPDP